MIHRFSEDIDIRVEPQFGQDIKYGRNHSKPAHVESRRTFYDEIAGGIKIPGIEQVLRDIEFDDLPQLRSAGIRLIYQARAGNLSGVKDGILLELGFDDTTPNRPMTISSWAWEVATKAGVAIIDNRAQDVPCYAPTHTFVEKLQTVSTKYRMQLGSTALPKNFMRHYYDLYCLLALDEVQAFIGATDYKERKLQRFRQGDELVIANNAAFLLADSVERDRFQKAYEQSTALYYQGQPPFDEGIGRIWANIERL